MIIPLENLSGQNLYLAKTYIKKGSYDKALPIYLDWMKNHPYRQDVYNDVIKIYRYQGKFDEGIRLASLYYNRYKNPLFLVDVYYFNLRKNDSTGAGKAFKKIRRALQTNTGYLIAVERRLRHYNYLDKALELLDTFGSRISYANIPLEKAGLYAEKGMIPEMMDNFIDALRVNPVYYNYVIGSLNRYVTADPGNEYNRTLKEKLVQRLASDPNPDYLRLLEWLYVKEGQYGKAFIQAKGLFLRKLVDANHLENLATDALEKGQTATARKITDFLQKRIQDLSGREQDRLRLIQSETEYKENRNNPGKIASYVPVWKNRAKQIKNPELRNNLNEIIADALMYDLKDYDESGRFLDSLVNVNQGNIYRESWEERRGDLWLLKKDFDRAAIEFTLLREKTPYQETGYRALYKIALASFFSGDFDWAHRNLKALKKAASRKIANDALLLDFMIIANKIPGDSLQRPLHVFSGLYYDYFTGHYQRLIRKADSIAPAFKGQKIYDDIRYLQAVSLEKTGHFDRAVDIWQEILSFTTEKIYREEALFHLGTIFEKHLNDPAKARTFYKKLLLEFPQGLHHDEVRAAYEKLKNTAI